MTEGAPLDLGAWTTPRLRLRALRATDAVALRLVTDDPAILESVHFLPRPFRLADADALIAGAAVGRDVLFGGWLVDEGRAAEGHLALVCGAHLLEDEVVEIGYWVGSRHRGRGLAFEASRSLVDRLRNRLPARRIVAECRRENVASWSLLKKLGFEETGEAGLRPSRRRLAM